MLFHVTLQLDSLCILVLAPSGSETPTLIVKKTARFRTDPKHTVKTMFCGPSFGADLFSLCASALWLSAGLCQGHRHQTWCWLWGSPSFVTECRRSQAGDVQRGGFGFRVFRVFWVFEGFGFMVLVLGGRETRFSSTFWCPCENGAVFSQEGSDLKCAYCFFPVRDQILASLASNQNSTRAVCRKTHKNNLDGRRQNH